MNVKCEPVSITSPSVSLNLILTSSSEDADASFVFSIDEDTKIISGALFVATLAVNGVSVVVPNALVAITEALIDAPLAVVEPVKFVFIESWPDELISNTPLPLLSVQVTDWFAENAACVPVNPLELTFIWEPLAADSIIYGPADQLSETVAGVSSVIGIVTIASLDAVLYASLTVTKYWYSFIKSEFIYTPVLRVTCPAEFIWNGFSCGSVACDVPS